MVVIITIIIIIIAIIIPYSFGSTFLPFYFILYVIISRGHMIHIYYFPSRY